MFIQTEATPNPAVLKFLPGRIVLEGEAAEFRAPEEAAKGSPLAAKLFAVPGVCGVFFGYDFIAVSKEDSAAWEHLKPAVLGLIMDYLLSGAPLVTEAAPQAAALAGKKEFYDAADESLVATIKALLEERVRPVVAHDGGDIRFHGFENGIVYLHMRGACAGCPSSTATLKQGIENLLRHFVPEVAGVEAVPQER